MATTSIPCTNKDGAPVANLKLDAAAISIINSAIVPNRLNPWYLVRLTVGGQLRQVAVKVVSGVATEAHYAD